MNSLIPQEFYEQISPLVKQISIVASNTFTQYKEEQKSISSVSFNFKNTNNLYEKQERSAFKYRLLEAPPGQRRLQIRLFNLETKENISPYMIEKIMINKSSYDIHRYIPKPKLINGIQNYKIFNCIDVTDILVEGINKIAIITTGLISNGIFTIVDIETVGLKNCVSAIERNCLRSTEFVSFNFEDDEDEINPNEMDVEQEEQTISLKCPISYMRMNIPSRGLNCVHLSCFDLENYIRNCTIKQSFNCPICCKPLPVNQLMIDDKVYHYLQSSDIKCTMIKVTQNGDMIEIPDEMEEENSDIDEEELKYLNRKSTLSNQINTLNTLQLPPPTNNQINQINQLNTLNTLNTVNTLQLPPSTNNQIHSIHIHSPPQVHYDIISMASSVSQLKQYQLHALKSSPPSNPLNQSLPSSIPTVLPKQPQGIQLPQSIPSMHQIPSEQKMQSKQLPQLNVNLSDLISQNTENMIIDNSTVDSIQSKVNDNQSKSKSKQELKPKESTIVSDKTTQRILSQLQKMQPSSSPQIKQKRKVVVYPANRNQNNSNNAYGSKGNNKDDQIEL